MERNLTQGKIGKSILLFSIPMILGNLLPNVAVKLPALAVEI